MKFQIDISVWEKLKNSDEPIIMYGTGNGADKVMDKLTELGISLSGITASSTFVRNRTFRGYQVMPLSYFEEKYEKFTVIVTFGTSIPDVMENIYSISENHRVLVPCVPVIGTEIFDKDFDEKYSLNGHMNPMGYMHFAEIIDSYIDYIILQYHLLD